MYIKRYWIFWSTTSNYNLQFYRINILLLFSIFILFSFAATLQLFRALTFQNWTSYFATFSLSLLLSPSSFLVIFYLPLNSFSVCILQFSMFCLVFSSRSSLYSFFFRSPQLDRPSFSLTHGIPPPLPVHRNPPFLLYSVEGALSLPFFPSLRSYLYLPAIIRFHWPSVPRRGNSGERGSLTFTSGDKYGFVWDIPLGSSDAESFRYWSAIARSSTIAIYSVPTGFVRLRHLINNFLLSRISRARAFAEILLYDSQIYSQIYLDISFVIDELFLRVIIRLTRQLAE